MASRAEQVFAAMKPAQQDAGQRQNGTVSLPACPDDLPIFPRTETAKSLADRELRPPKEIIPGVLREGLALLAANKGMGKSYLALAFGIGVSDTGKVLAHDIKGGGIAVECGDVLYIANESDPAEMIDRLHVLSDAEEWPERLEVAYGSKRLHH
jgi:RecA-family ATPase